MMPIDVPSGTPVERPTECEGQFLLFLVTLHKTLVSAMTDWLNCLKSVDNETTISVEYNVAKQ